MKIAFTLLHYNNLQVTKEAVRYLEELKGSESSEIIIVDNASPNNTGKELKKLYADEPNITVIINNKNGGFAYGNNIGYKFAKKKGCEIIVVMNNDVFIKDKEFINKLKVAIKNTDAEIIAPNIIGQKGPQNPLRLERLSDAKINKMLRYNQVINFIYHIPLINRLLAKILDRKSKNEKHLTPNIKNGTECIPHGACIIYLPKWINKENFAFLPKTFMYFEEDILGEYIWQRNYKAIYNNTLTVYHVEDASVEYDNKTSVKRRMFISGCMKESIVTLRQMRLKETKR